MHPKHPDCLDLNGNPENNAEEDTCLDLPHLIKLKRDGHALTKRQIGHLVGKISDGTMEDAQLGAFLMSVFLKGMTNDEVASLTDSMRYSGTVFNWQSNWTVVDKHSTGGVGDKISLVLAPVLASLGLKVPMISGRGLGHTGGTLDKLESITGFRVSLSENEMKNALEEVGCCIVGQTKTIVPADKRMYSIRDVTSTVQSIPLIVSSIISKKACESLHSLVLDVKYGSGAVMKEQFEAETLAQALVSAGNGIGIATTALVTSNEQPIGKKIGNSLEVEEAIDCLRGKGPDDLKHLVTHLGAELLISSGRSKNMQEATKEIEGSLVNGAALKVFEKMIKFQGVSDDLARAFVGQNFEENCLVESKSTTELCSLKTGFVINIDALTVAEVCSSLGAGRKTSKDSIKNAVGMILKKVSGDKIERGETWAVLKHDDELDKAVIDKCQSALTINTEFTSIHPENIIAKRFS